MQILAASTDDLLVVSALVQDGIARVGDLRREASARRFTLALNRFRWELVQQGKQPSRVRSGLMIEGVSAVRTKNLSRGKPDAVIDILSLEFSPDEAHPPAGCLRIILAGDGVIELDVECIDVTLADVSKTWGTRRLPDHETDG
jgi:Protein of unknown function (DUF2948)